MARFLNSSTDLLARTTPFVTATANFAFSIWVYPLSPLVSGGGTVCLNGNGGANGFGVFTQGSGSDGKWRFNRSGIAEADGTISTALNAWSHVCINAVGTTLTLYINGVSSVSASGINNPSGASQFGNALNANIAEGTFWNTPLSVAEISALAKFADAKLIRPASIVAYYPLNGLQSPEPDLSGNVNNMTLTGTALAAGPPAMPFTPRWHRFLGWTPALPAAGLGWVINRRNKLMVPRKRA